MDTTPTPALDERTQHDLAPTLELALPESRAGRAPAWRRRLSHLLGRVVWSALVCLLLAGIVFAVLWQSLPSTSNLETWVTEQDAAHSVEYVPISQVAPMMLQALVSAEDEHFYQHHGIDTVALLRAAWDDLRASRLVEGGSTLTAQLAKNAYLGGQDHTIPRKIQDLVLALKIERNYTKADILEMYLNLVYFGEGAYGIGAAASRYFATYPAKLDLAQSALLAGLVQAPGYYDPWCHPQQSRAKQHAVLARMVADGYISEAESAAAAREVFSFWQPGISRPNDTYCPA